MAHVTQPVTLREHISFSQLQLAAQCGEAYRRKYVAGDPTGTLNMPALIGSAFHLAVPDWEAALLERRLGYDDAWKQLVAITKDYTRWMLDEQDLESSDVPYFGNQDIHWWYREGIPKLAGNYVKRRYEEVDELAFEWFAGDPAIACEMECLVNIADHAFLGYIDQLFFDSQGRLVVRDLKTGKRKDTHAMQMEVYRLATKLAVGMEPAYGQVLYVGSDKGPKVEVVKFQLDDDEVAGMVNRLVQTQQAHTYAVSGPFNGACSYCDYRADCPWGAVQVRGTS